MGLNKNYKFSAKRKKFTFLLATYLFVYLLVYNMFACFLKLDNFVGGNFFNCKSKMCRAYLRIHKMIFISMVKTIAQNNIRKNVLNYHFVFSEFTSVLLSYRCNMLSGVRIPLMAKMGETGVSIAHPLPT